MKLAKDLAMILKFWELLLQVERKRQGITFCGLCLQFHFNHSCFVLVQWYCYKQYLDHLLPESIICPFSVIFGRHVAFLDVIYLYLETHIFPF